MSPTTLLVSARVETNTLEVTLQRMRNIGTTFGVDDNYFPKDLAIDEMVMAPHFEAGIGFLWFVRTCGTSCVNLALPRASPEVDQIADMREWQAIYFIDKTTMKKITASEAKCIAKKAPHFTVENRTIRDLNGIAIASYRAKPVPLKSGAYDVEVLLGAFRWSLDSFEPPSVSPSNRLMLEKSILDDLILSTSSLFSAIREVRYICDRDIALKSEDFWKFIDADVDGFPAVALSVDGQTTRIPCPMYDNQEDAIRHRIDRELRPKFMGVKGVRIAYKAAPVVRQPATATAA